MLKIQDFRIGNYVNCTHKDYVNFTYVTEVQELTGWAFWHYQRRDEPNHELELRALSPIPLTEQWLLDFGFEKREENYYLLRFLIEKGLSQFFDNGYSFRIVIDNKNSCHVNTISYVHQLQNLYYCITGEELTKK